MAPKHASRCDNGDDNRVPPRMKRRASVPCPRREDVSEDS
eukprot:CAMPEP_0194219784 /NCGR_PEP_ID=MMETSP0156-20130528/26861_1 /TAXON_ID=33649 /ORGANISM="Thalassionema nitzschioides, Strain L26-B" /LENGTH=39 /DNA_ID= /DNA_START= /DNA_END= /DNA_ORIENTATION=